MQTIDLNLIEQSLLDSEIIRLDEADNYVVDNLADFAQGVVSEVTGVEFQQVTDQAQINRVADAAVEHLDLDTMREFWTNEQIYGASNLKFLEAAVSAV